MSTSEKIDAAKRQQEAILKGKIKIAEAKKDKGNVRQLKRELRQFRISYGLVRLMGVKNFEKVLSHIAKDS